MNKVSLKTIFYKISYFLFIEIISKHSITLKKGDVLVIETTCGGVYGRQSNNDEIK